MNGELKYKDITEKIIGASFEVHKFLGNGFQEVIYQRCLAIEFRKAGLEFVREKDEIVYYEGEEVGNRRADFIVEGDIIVELKALINLEDVHLAQAKNYVVAYRLAVGLLINWKYVLTIQKSIQSENRIRIYRIRGFSELEVV